MNLGSAFRRGGRLGLWLVGAYFALMLILAIDHGPLNDFAVRAIGGGDPRDPSVVESYQFVLFYSSILMAAVGVLALATLIVGSWLARTKRHSNAA